MHVQWMFYIRNVVHAQSAASSPAKNKQQKEKNVYPSFESIPYVEGILVLTLK
jgi:hypothetical protein